jgi:hypothetical protein
MKRARRGRSGVETRHLARAAALTRCGLALASASNSDVVRRNAQRHVARTLGRLRGLPQKLGQMLASGSDAVRAEEFACLTDAAEPVPLEALRPELERAFGGPLERELAELEPHGLAASLGQVHRGRLRDGRAVAIKVRYPKIAQAVEADLGLLGWLSKPLGGLSRGFDLGGYRTEIGAMLARELDYRQEAREQREYAHLARGHGVVVPSVLEAYSTEAVLLSTWEAGETLEEAATWTRAERAALAHTLAQHHRELLFRDGVAHADLHAGNLRYRRGAGPVLYDFGCVLRLGDTERQALLSLASGVSARDPWLDFLALGFDAERLEPLRSRLGALCALVFAPYRARGPFDYSSFDPGPDVDALLGEERWNLRIAGPPRLVYLMRSLHGLWRHLARLAEPVELAPLALPERPSVAPPAIARPTAGNAARWLTVCVRADGEQRARVSLPASALERLDEVLDEELRARIAAQGIDLAEVVRRSRAGGHAPGKLFRIDESSRSVDVRLE